LYYHELVVSIRATADLHIDGWLGAALRNRLLFAADHVNVMGGVSLRQVINLLTIKDRHPLYKKMEEGFPRGYGLSLLSHQEAVSPCRIPAGDAIHFSVILYGHFSEYYHTFIQALEWMCRHGLGTPFVPCLLERICERAADGQLYTCYEKGSQTQARLCAPVTLESFMQQKFAPEEKEIRIRYDVPVSFFKSTSKPESTYKNNGHEFPGFYPLVHAAAFRVATLSALYACPNDFSMFRKFDDTVDDFLKHAHALRLSSAEIRRVECYGMKKPDGEHRIRFSAYVGEVGFTGYFNYYVPLLLFARNIGVGSHATYGMGRYSIVR